MKPYDTSLRRNSNRKYEIGVRTEEDSTWRWYTLKAKCQDAAVIESKLGIAHLLGEAATRVEEESKKLEDLAHALRSEAMRVIHG